jgi:regulatory protein
LPRGGPDALEAAIGALRRRERTSAELAAWLRHRGHTDEEIGAALGRLSAAGELDDERFARRYAEDKRELRGWGSERIREALAAKGLPRDLVSRALGTESREAEIERACALLRRGGRRLADDADRARALGFLTRRGYDYEAAYEAVRAATRAAG